MTNRVKSALLLLTVAVLALGSSACSDSSETKVEKVFKAAPWTGKEANEYNLVATGGDIYGACVLKTEPEFESGKTRLSRLCGDGPNRDDGVVAVDTKTFRPLSATRSITDSTKNSRTTFSATYEDGRVNFVADVNGKQNEASRDLPAPDKTSPDPGWYDDESLLWLVRSIDLKAGYQASYMNVNAGNGRVFAVELLVEQTEKVRVPAGEFNTWRIRIKTESITQYAWVLVDAPHTLVKARIERLTYELTAAK